LKIVPFVSSLVNETILEMRVSHRYLLENALLQYSNSDPEIVVICNDEQHISTSKFLLAFYSKSLQSIFNSIESQTNVSLYLPVSSVSVINLLNILATGMAEAKDTRDLMEVNNAAKVLGIPFKGWELTSKENTGSKKHGSDKTSVKLEEFKVKTEVVEYELANVENTFTFPEEDSVYKKINTSKGKPKLLKEKGTHNEIDKPKEELRTKQTLELKSELKREKDKIRQKRSTCGKCSRVFVNRKSMEDHLNKKVCERKMAHDEKIRQMMQKAKDIVNSGSRKNLTILPS